MTIHPLSFEKDFVLQTVGGKALALQRMIQAGFPVPPGWVLPVDFFTPWYALLEASPTWGAWADGREETIRAAAQTLQEQCRALRLDAPQQQQLATALSSPSAGSPAVLFAVRSSSPDEDLENASFAGGYETTLGVTPAGLEAAIRRSFASSFDARVFLYKKERGIALTHPRIAVIIQQQINADSAGVAFSLNPLNNCFDEAVINANHGLGESVVAGETEPDLFVVDKIDHAILETRPGKKQTVIQLEPAGGTHTVTREHQHETAISAAQALALTDLLIKIEAYEQTPVDIEWAIADGKIYLLQVRPITTYLPLPAEMVTAPGAPKRLYANSTLIEQGLQEPLSVLGTDFIGYLLNKVGGAIADGAIGIDGIAFTATGGYYMNVSYAQMMGMHVAGLAPGSFGDPRVLEILDSIDMKDYTRGDLPAKLKKNRGGMIFKMLPMAKSVLMAYLKPQRALANYQAALPAALERLENFSGSGMTLQQHVVALTSMLTFFTGDTVSPMVLAGQMAQQRIQKLFKNEGTDVQDHLINLGISLPGNKTAEMGKQMYDLASSDELSHYEDSAQFLTDLAQGKLSASFRQNWEQYLAEFGMRCPGEIDPATSRPYEHPAQVFEQLKSLGSAIRNRHGSGSFFEESGAKRETAYQALRTIALKKGKRQAKSFDKLYNIWLTLGGQRETPKHYIITVVDMFRRSIVKIGERLVAQGRLDRPAQIFDLSISQIDQALTNPALDLRSLARDQAAFIQKIRYSKRTARILDSRGKIFYPPRKPAAAGELSGVPIAPGLIQGRVKVLHSADEKPLLPGEILVARATDPGWTPLFLNAKGIILEIGGALQHGAVVAREYGIPCVSGVDNATDLLKDGQTVEVDGSHGIIRVLDGEIPAARPLSDAENQQQQNTAARVETERAKQQVKQTIMRLVPLIILPFIILGLFVSGYIVTRLLIGQTLAQITFQLGDLWQRYRLYLQASTIIVSVPLLTRMLWRNRIFIKRILSKQADAISRE